MYGSLKGKAALVTGGGRGLGRAIAGALAAEGVHVAVGFYGNEEAADGACLELRDKYGVRAMAVQGDVSREDDVRRMFRQITEAFSGLDILVNNGGVCPVSMIENTEFSEWKRVIDTNLNGVFLTSREMVRHLIRNNNKGSIINIASQSAFNGSKHGKSHYAASKGGVVSFTISLAKEVAAYGIRVNAVCPGMLHTDMTRELLDAELERYKAQIPLGRIADLSEPANVVVFLASELASYMTGSVVDVSGGLMSR